MAFTLAGRIFSRAEIICVGTELLIGHTVNTNAAYLSTELANLGILSYRQVVIGDNPERLLEQIRESAPRNDLILFTGGLGPTDDDLTMEVCARAASRKMIFDPQVYDSVKTYFDKMGKTMCRNCAKQAYIPEGAHILPNTNGTAPGVVFDCPAPDDDHPDHVCTFVLLPGPPSEVKPMFEKSVRELLADASSFRLMNTFVHLVGIGESAAEQKIHDLIETQTNPTIAPYASEGECMFRVTVRVQSEDDLKRRDALIDTLKERFGDYIYEIGTRSLPEVVFQKLRDQGRTVAFAESCTAGMISSAFGDIPGVSAVFPGAVVSYDNRIKTRVLGVREATLQEFGAVSSECAREMAEGVRRVMETDYSVSITGIAGPDGGTVEKPVGLVFIAVCDEGGTSCEKFQFSGNRMRIRKNAVLAAFNMLRKRLI